MHKETVKYLLIIVVTTILLPSSSFAQQVQFEEVTSSAGMIMHTQSRWSTGLAWGDYDNDGRIDVYVTSWGQASTGQGRNAM